MEEPMIVEDDVVIKDESSPVRRLGKLHNATK